MPANLEKINQDKERILSFLRNKGPSLPIHISKAASLSVLFASAFLSELYAEGKIKMSNMKVGSSSLYFIPGQDAQLENFIEYLNQKEKEAFYLLKEGSVLLDDDQVPAIRVALRAIKDFAIPLKAQIGENSKNYWRFFQISEKEAAKIINDSVNKKKNNEIEDNKVIKEEIIPDTKLQIPQTPLTKQESNKTPLIKAKKERKVLKDQNSDFLFNIKSFLEKKEIEVITILLEKKKEFWAIGRANSVFGKQEYYIIAKEKKKITEQEIDQALERSQAEKMPVLILAPGELDKKAAMRILSLRNLIKFINFNQ